jgi:hypothetical protein
VVYIAANLLMKLMFALIALLIAMMTSNGQSVFLGYVRGETGKGNVFRYDAGSRQISSIFNFPNFTSNPLNISSPITSIDR